MTIRLSSAAPNPLRAPRPLRASRRFSAIGAALALTVLLGACGGSESTSPANDTAANANTTAATQGTQTPNARPPESASAGTAAEPEQTGVASQIIDTPPEILATKPGQKVLATDYKPAPTDRSIVLTAAVPKVDIYDSATSTTPTSALANPIESGAPLTFLVDGMTSTRYKVLLPIRPNGSTGWVDPAQVSVMAHRYKIIVELNAHHMTVYNGDEVVMSEKIGVGRDATPTPNGRYYIKELIRPCYSDGKGGPCKPNDNGPYGPFAYGLSGFSPVLDDYRGGKGEIGIHGTDEPDKIGTDVSHGCIRMANDAIRQLAKILPLGTPVVVKA